MLFAALYPSYSYLYLFIINLSFTTISLSHLLAMDGTRYMNAAAASHPHAAAGLLHSTPGLANQHMITVSRPRPLTQQTVSLICCLGRV